MWFGYSIVKDSSADLGVNIKIVQNRPTVKAVCTKISKKFFLKNLIFKILYFLKLCPVFVSSVHNFGNSDNDKI